MGYAIKKEKERKKIGEVFYVQYFLSSLLPGCVFLIFSPFFFFLFCFSFGFVWFLGGGLKMEKKRKEKTPSA